MGKFRCKSLFGLQKMARLIFLTQPEIAPVVAPLLKKVGVAYTFVMERDELDRAMATADAGTRIVAFAAKVIVPAAYLSRLSGPAYNFHPGPPEYPGIYPSVYALYD